MAVEKEDIREAFEELEDEFGIEGYDQFDTYVVDKKTGEIRFNYEGIKPLESVEDIKPVIFKILRGEIRPADGFGIFFAAYLDAARDKRFIQSRIFDFIAKHYDFHGDDYLKSTFTMSKIENRLMTNPDLEEDGVNQFKKLKDREAEIITMQNALSIALDFVKLAERSSWGRKQIKDS